MSCCRIRFAAILVLAFARAADAETVSLTPLKDNTLIQRADPAAQLSNALGDIFVGRTNQNGQGPATTSIRRGLISFDIAGNIPAGATVTSATLTLRNVRAFNGDRTVELHRTLADWGEGTSTQSGGSGAPATMGDATWLYRFFNAATPSASPAWTTPGGDFSADATAAVLISDDAGSGQLFSWTSAENPQMLADVRAWLDNPSENFGWTMIGDESAGRTAKRFNSGEATTPPNLPPMLEIEYNFFVIGDTDDDGDVDLDDLNNVRNNFGGSEDGDADGDNDTDLDDLNAVRNNFGATSGASALPEPTSAALLAIAISFFAFLASFAS